jgi:hypothetical protein
MLKYPAATALVIALITMLTLAGSVSLTPANAFRRGGPVFRCTAGIYPKPGIYCELNCETELWSTAKLWDFTRNPPGSCPPLLQACVATCLKAKQAAQR